MCYVKKTQLPVFEMFYKWTYLFLVFYDIKLLLLMLVLTPTPPHGSRTNMGVIEPEDTGEINIKNKYS